MESGQPHCREGRQRKAISDELSVLEPECVKTQVHIPEQTPGTRSSRPGQAGVPMAPCHPRTSSAARLSAGTWHHEGLVIAVIANSLNLSRVALFSYFMSLLCPRSINSLLTSLVRFSAGLLVFLICGSSSCTKEMRPLSFSFMRFLPGGGSSD